MREEVRTIKVRCTTWEQVETFYTEKLRGDALVVKVPFEPGPGDSITVALGMPNGLVFAIDGSVMKVGVKDATGRIPVAMRMYGLTEDVRKRLKQLVEDGKQGLLSHVGVLPKPDGVVAPTASGPQEGLPPATPADVPVSEVVEAAPEPRFDDCVPEEQPAYLELDKIRWKHQELSAHELLGITEQSDLRSIRAAYLGLAKKYHPDVFGRYQSLALRLLAQEVFIHINKAYDRMREAAIRAGGVALPGPARQSGTEPLAAFDDVTPVEVGSAVGSGHASAPRPSAEPAPRVPPHVPDEEPDDEPFDSARVAGRLTAESLFGDMELGAEGTGGRKSTAEVVAASTEDEISQGRAALDDGRWPDACARFAAALRAEPRNRAVRALYHVASGHELRGRGKAAEAVLQFETALVHDRECTPALAALGRLPDKRGRAR